MLMQIAAMSQVSTARPAFTQMSLRSIPQRGAESTNAQSAKPHVQHQAGNVSALIHSLISRLLDFSTDLYQTFYTALLNLVPNLSQSSFMTVDSFRSLLYNIVEEVFGVIHVPTTSALPQESNADHFVPLSSQNSNSIVSAKDRQFTYQSVNAKAGNQGAEVQSIPSRGSVESQSQSFPSEVGSGTLSSDSSRNIAVARLYLVGQA